MHGFTFWSPYLGVSVLVMIGGDATGNEGLNNEVWLSTTSGTSWTLLTASAAFPPHNHGQSVALPNGVLVLGPGKETEGSTPFPAYSNGTAHIYIYMYE